MQPRMNIAFFGSSLVSAYWNGAATYYRGILRALHELGYRTTFYEPNAFDRQKHRDIADPEYAEIVVYEADDEKDVLEAVGRARSADLVVKASGVGVHDELLEQAVLDLRSSDRMVVFWDVDAPATLERMQENAEDPFRALVPEYDMILTYGGGQPVVSSYEAAGARLCVPIYNALDGATHYPVEPDVRFEGELGFLGNRMPDREMRVWEFFFNPARRLSDRRFLIGGSGWEQHVLDAENVSYLGHVYTRDHNAFNCTPKAVLNITRESMVRYGYSPPTRVFEAAGAGACLITDAWEGVELFLKPGAECLVAESGDDVVRFLRNLDAGRARAVGEAARERVLSEHTYTHRAAQFDELLTDVRSAAGGGTRAAGYRGP